MLGISKIDLTVETKPTSLSTPLRYHYNVCSRVVFPESVKWVCVEFSPECGTGQAEDSLQLYIPAPPSGSVATPAASSVSPTEDSVPYCPVLHRLSNLPAQWPQSAIVLPGMYVGQSLVFPLVGVALVLMKFKK